MWRVLAAVLLVGAGIGIGFALSRDAESPPDSPDTTEEPTATPTPTPTTTPEPSSPESPTTAPPAEPGTSEDGRYFAYVREVKTEAGSTLLVVDYAQFLTGEEAAAAAADAGFESPPPNDYFIANTNPRLRTFPVANDLTSVTLTTTWGGVKPDGYDLFFDEWTAMFSRPMPEGGFVRDVPYWITIADGAVTDIEEQYLP